MRLVGDQCVVVLDRLGHFCPRENLDLRIDRLGLAQPVDPQAGGRDDEDAIAERFRRDQGLSGLPCPHVVGEDRATLLDQPAGADILVLVQRRGLSDRLVALQVDGELRDARALRLVLRTLLFRQLLGESTSQPCARERGQYGVERRRGAHPRFRRPVEAAVRQAAGDLDEGGIVGEPHADRIADAGDFDAGRLGGLRRGALGALRLLRDLQCGQLNTAARELTAVLGQHPPDDPAGPRAPRFLRLPPPRPVAWAGIGRPFGAVHNV